MKKRKKTLKVNDILELETVPWTSNLNRFDSPFIRIKFSSHLGLIINKSLKSQCTVCKYVCIKIMQLLYMELFWLWSRLIGQTVRTYRFPVSRWYTDCQILFFWTTRYPKGKQKKVRLYCLQSFIYFIHTNSKENGHFSKSVNLLSNNSILWVFMCPWLQGLNL